MAIPFPPLPLEAPIWAFPTDPGVLAQMSRGEELIAEGADLEPATLIGAYRAGLFPMPVGRRRVGWWSPARRGVLPLDGLRISRSLRRSIRRYEIRVDTAFEQVIAGCADPRRAGAWIDRQITDAYTRLHSLGWAHSVEAWDREGLAGGLYGVSIGGLFAGESMFHHRTDASKVALAGLVDRLNASGGKLLDVQWATPHLCSLGVVEIPRAEYHRRLIAVVDLPPLQLARP